MAHHTTLDSLRKRLPVGLVFAAMTLAAGSARADEHCNPSVDTQEGVTTCSSDGRVVPVMTHKSPTLYSAGLVTTIAGAVALGAGSLLVLSTYGDYEFCDQACNDHMRDRLVAGGITLAAGTAVAGTGVLMMLLG